MNIVLMLSLLLVSVPVGYLAWTALSTDRKGRKIVQANLNRGFEKPEEGRTGNPSLFYRLGRTLTPAGYVKKLDRLLSLAGRPASMPFARLLAGKPAMAILGAVVGLLFFALNPGPTIVVIGVFLTVLGYFIPDLMLYSKGQERQKAIQLELPNTLDQMLISVEAGLGFESAMWRAGSNGRGPLAEELVRALQDMQVGRSRRESYLAISDRTSVPELRSFVKAIVQADAYGIALSKVLRTQAKVMRVRRRQRAEEKAMKLPVMVLFPLLFFIFPVLFIVILGPAVINAMETFGGG
ncbi:type II secretion system F family protein [Arthrobacter monumenti]